MLDSHGGAHLSTCLIHSGTLVCMDAAFTVARGDVLVRDGAIAALGDAVPAALERLPGRVAAETIDATGCFVIPGLVHGHLHLCQTLFRGLAEQADLLCWLRESIWPLEAAHTERSIASSARLGLLELIAGGVTTINDMGTVRHTEALIAAVADSGIRAIVGKALMDQGDGAPAELRDDTRAALDESLALAARWHGAAGGRLHVSLAPRFILSCSEALWHGVRDASEERGLLVHTHLAESPSEGREVEAMVGATAARWFERQRVLTPRFVGAHGVWLDGDELQALARADAALVHCPGSNLKLGSGFARVRRWRDAQVRRGLGSDGAACNNRLDTFHEMSLAAGLSRVLDGDAPIQARDVLALATRDGAAALGLGASVGSLEAGKQADIVVVDHDAPHQGPQAEADPYVTLVHATRATDVRATLVAGRILYRDGQWTTLDPERVLAEARAEARGLARRVQGRRAA